jgi:RNA-binding protein YlmH
LAVNMIQSKRVKVNYQLADRKDELLSENDLVSIKGVGRIQILRSLGLSKKDKLKVEISTIFHHKK